MLSVPVRKDISEYQSKILGKLTLRTLIVIISAVSAAIAIACIFQFALGIDWSRAQLLVYAVTFAIWAVGLKRPCGMSVEKFAPFWVRHNLTDDRCVYVSSPKAERRDRSTPKKLRLSAAYSRLAATPGIEAMSMCREGVEADGQ